MLQEALLDEEAAWKQHVGTCNIPVFINIKKNARQPSKTFFTKQE
jgi:hypothetical protein